MTNGEKFKTAKERRAAYHKHLSIDSSVTDEFLWLELEAKEELLPCPFCGGKAIVANAIAYAVVMCKSCETKLVKGTVAEAINAWNRRVK